jgi:hypothetical protein
MSTIDVCLPFPAKFRTTAPFLLFDPNAEADGCSCAIAAPAAKPTPKVALATKKSLFFISIRMLSLIVFADLLD